MQFKIKRLVYIDAFPEFDMFEGVIGNAYIRLFRPIVGIKEELSRYKC